MKSTNGALLLLPFLTAGLIGCSSSNNSGDLDSGEPSRESALIEIGQLQHLLMPRQSPLARQSSFRLGMPPATECLSGSVDVEELEKERDFVFYGSSEHIADAKIWLLDSCRNADKTEDGGVEIGALQGFDPINLSDSYDQYAVYGAAEEAYRLEISAGIEEISGNVEWRGYDDMIESATIINRTVERANTQPHTLVWEQGASDDPLRIQQSISNDILAIEGPYAWATSRCTGGARRVQATDIGFGEANSVYFSNLTITAGNASMNVRSSSDGSATVVFHDGTTIDLSEEEIRAELEEPRC